MQNSNCAVIITEKPGYTFKILSFWHKKLKKNRMTFSVFCLQMSVTFSNQAISRNIICVSLLVSSFMNMQKQDMVNNFHIRVKKRKTEEKMFYLSMSLFLNSDVILKIAFCASIVTIIISIGSWQDLLVLNKILATWLNIRKFSFIQFLSFKSYKRSKWLPYFWDTL